MLRIKITIFLTQNLHFEPFHFININQIPQNTCTYNQPNSIPTFSPSQCPYQHLRTRTGRLSSHKARNGITQWGGPGQKESGLSEELAFGGTFECVCCFYFSMGNVYRGFFWGLIKGRKVERWGVVIQRGQQEFGCRLELCILRIRDIFAGLKVQDVVSFIVLRWSFKTSIQ